MRPQEKFSIGPLSNWRMRCGIFPTTIIRTAEHLKEADVIFSDNFFDLMPGETRTVRVASELNAKELARRLKSMSLADTY